METEIVQTGNREPRPVHADDCLVTNKQLREILGGVSEMHVWRLMNDPKHAPLKFPTSIKINRRNYWRIADVRQWINRQAARTGKAAA
jgi:predicted DNA-binding transcriptional regulator AlpA